MLQYVSNIWKKWPHKGITYVILLGVILALIVLIAMRGGKVATPQPSVSPEPKVQAQTLEALSKTATIDTVTSVQLANSAPLVARLGGRVTKIYGPLGSYVQSGSVIVDIDGGSEANPARVQEENASLLLGLFNNIQTQTEASLNSSIVLASNSLSAARAGSTITGAIQSKNRDLATNGINQAQIARDKALDAGNDFIIRSATVGVDAAKLAATQALLAQRLSNRETSDAVKQAQQNVASANIAKSQTLATLASQKAGLEAQLRSAAEQVRLMRVTAPLSGEVSRLSVQVGDFVHPGDVVGEVFGGNNATATLFIPSGARKGLYVGQAVDVVIDGETKTGIISALSANAGADTALWQVNIALKGAAQAHSTVTVKLPIAAQNSNTLFVPLDAVNVRQSGAVVLTVKDGIVTEHVFTPVHYYSNYVEGTADIPSAALVITSGNRTLRDGDRVSVESNS